MYDQFYGLTGRPFQLTPDPFFYFESGTHRKAMSYLGYGLAQGEGFIVITGDIGAGKTTLVGHLMNTIDPNRLTAVKLVSTQVEGDDLLRLVAEQFQLEWDGLSKAELLRGIEQYLREQARAGRRTLLIVDEGQNLSISALEELRMLSNFQLGGHSLLQIFLLGQPEFRQTLFQSPTLEQLRQRVIATHHLEPMEPEEIEPYIEHRLGKVGWDGNPSFSPDAIEEIYDHSDGVPRKLNVLVSRLLLFGAVEQLNRITGDHVRAVVEEAAADRGEDVMPIAPPSVDDAPEATEIFATVPEAPEPVADAIVAAVPEPAIEELVAEEVAEDAPAETFPIVEEEPLQWPAPAKAIDAEKLDMSTPSVDLAESDLHDEAESYAFTASDDGEDLPPLNTSALAQAFPYAEEGDGEEEEEDVLPPSFASDSFVAARSLVAAQLHADDDDVLDLSVPAVSDANVTTSQTASETMAAEDTAHDLPPIAPPGIGTGNGDAVGVEQADETLSVEKSVSSDQDAQLIALERQIAGLEARITDQDAALRRVLDLLIDWVERDPANAPSARNWAA